MKEEQRIQEAANVKQTCEAFNISEFKYYALLGKVKEQMHRRGEFGQVILTARFQDALDAHHAENAHKPKDDLGSSLFDMMSSVNSAIAAGYGAHKTRA